MKLHPSTMEHCKSIERKYMMWWQKAETESNDRLVDLQLCNNDSTININNSLYLYSAFLGTQSALHRRGGVSPQPPPVCSIHLDDATAVIFRQNAHHTPVYWWRGDRLMKPISVWGWLGGHDGQRPMGKYGQNAGVTPLLFFEGHPGI